MSKRKLVGGFTLIEVTLVLAVATMMFVGVVANTMSNIARERYNSAVQNTAEFLRQQYAEVISVQNTRVDDIDSQTPCTTTSGWTAGDDYATAPDVQTGRSNCLIYGKLITFGEELAWDDNTDEFDYIIHSYDVIGDAVSTRDLEQMNLGVNGYSKDDIKNELVRSLANVSAGVMNVQRNNKGKCTMGLAGNTYSYVPEWKSYLRDLDETRDDWPFAGSLLIVRSPLTGMIDTFVLSEPVPVQEALELINGYGLLTTECGNVNARLASLFDFSLEAYLADEDDPPRVKEVSFCVESEDTFALGGGRRMISVARDGYNASAIRVEDQDSEANLCL